MSKQTLPKSIINKSDETFQTEFEKLIEQRKNESVKKIVEKLSPTVPLTAVVDFSGTTLLHLAAKYNNVDLISYFAKSGCNINAKNSFGAPLATAFVQFHVESVDALLNLGAELAIEDVEGILIRYTAEAKLPEPTIAALMKRLRKCTKDTQTMTDLLIRIKFPLKIVVYFGEAVLTNSIIPYSQFNDDKLVFEVLSYVIKVADFENLKLLWHRNRLDDYYNESFYPIREKIIVSSVNSGYKLVFKQINKWITFDREFQAFLLGLFKRADKSTLQILLHECDLDVQLKRNYDFVVLPMLFSNPKINNEDMFRLVRNRKFDVNAKTFGGHRALHYVATHSLHEKIRLLFEMGADSNVKDDIGNWAFELVSDVNCCEAFLQGNNQLRIGENYEEKVLTLLTRDSYSALYNLRPILLAQLAVESRQGMKITQKIVDKIQSCQSLQQHYDDCLRQIDLMMNYEGLPNLTMFRILTTGAEKWPLYIQNRETITTITQWCSEQRLHPFYVSSLKFNSEKALTLYLSRCQLADIICKNTSVLIYYDDLVINKIIGHLVYKDMIMLASA